MQKPIKNELNLLCFLSGGHFGHLLLGCNGSNHNKSTALHLVTIVTIQNSFLKTLKTEGPVLGDQG